jgi:phage gp36-like protein
MRLKNMSYTTLAKLKKTFGKELLSQLSDDEDTGDIIVENINEVILQAESEVDPKLRGRYPTGIATIVDLPKTIETYANDIFIYRMYCRKATIKIPDHITTNYNNALKQLDKIPTGESTPFEEDDEPDIIISNKTSTSKVFNSTVKDTYYTGL